MDKKEIEGFLSSIERKAARIQLNYDDELVVKQEAETIEDLAILIKSMLYE